MQIKRGFTASVAVLVLAGAATAVAVAPAPARTSSATAPFAAAGPSAAKDPAFCDFDDRLTPPTIREGAAGDTVREAQCLLQLWGFYVGPRGVDGAFGPLTTSAAKAFQTSRGLTADGIIGPNTWTRLRNG
ncbi:peptidoglycan-binding domain-containing protein [Streptomyces sp. NPDC048417]|uniref:peptidoglycan-binding domain-containing protein n=1 Tax=Streptomyces sp. NPDC048417 TaxID=3155387 RepID=UPI00341CB7F0